MEGSQGEERVRPLELFFDLVFVFAITQVTTMLSADPTWGGLLRGLIVLAALWWAWAAYAWLTNTLNPEEGIVRIAMFVVMASMLIVEDGVIRSTAPRRSWSPRAARAYRARCMTRTTK